MLWDGSSPWDANGTSCTLDTARGVPCSRTLQGHTSDLDSLEQPHSDASLTPVRADQGRRDRERAGGLHKCPTSWIRPGLGCSPRSPAGPAERACHALTNTSYSCRRALKWNSRWNDRAIKEGSGKSSDLSYCSSGSWSQDQSGTTAGAQERCFCSGEGRGTKAVAVAALVDGRPRLLQTIMGP